MLPGLTLAGDTSDTRVGRFTGMLNSVGRLMLTKDLGQWFICWRGCCSSPQVDECLHVADKRQASLYLFVTCLLLPT